jgi:endonuclease/exonuclease/phosphatase family metal-dependent hydrolase
MRVLTWNLWWQFGDWEARQPVIAAELAAVDPDIALFQEVFATDERDQADELGSVTGLHVARTEAMSGDRAGKPQRFGNAILSRWPIHVLEQIALPGPDENPSHRSALATMIDAPAGPLVAVVTHLAWHYDQSALRERQLDEIAGLVARHQLEPEQPPNPATSRPPEPPPVLLAGDMNAVPESDEIRRLTGLSRPYRPGLVFTDAWAAVGDGPGFTWTRDNPNSAEALWPRRRLDYVFVSWPRPKPYANPRSARLVGVSPRTGVVGSDHYGVLAELDDRPSLDQPS